jgi:hypothetical protein
MEGDGKSPVAEPAPFQERGVGGNHQGSGPREEVAPPKGVYDVDVMDYDECGSKLLDTFVERFNEVLKLFGANNVVLLSARANLVRLCASGDEAVVTSKAKKFCESFSARLFGTAHDPVLIDGSFGRWIKSRLGLTKAGLKRAARHGVTSSACELAESLAKAKGCLGHASDRMVTEALRAHCSKVENSVPDDSTIDEVKSALAPVLEELAAIMRPLFETARAGPPPRQTGSIQSSRTLGGKGGGLYRYFHGCCVPGDDGAALWKASDRVTELPINRPTGRQGTARFDHLRDEELPDEAVLWEEPTVVTEPRLQPDGSVRLESKLEYPASELRWNAWLLQEALREVETGESRDVHVTAISEAGGKVRIVTKGSQAAATVASIWQQIAFSAMRLLPCFPSLSGKITGERINQLLTEWLELAGSSDFTASTDLLNPKLTNWILHQLLDGFAAAGVVMDDNANKTIHYPPVPKVYDGNRAGREGYIVVRGQVFKLVPLNSEGVPKFKGVKIGYLGTVHHVCSVRMKAEKDCGQLMGQLTSFPLLCLANLGASLAAFLANGIDRETALARVVINGDDRLARSTPAIEADFWRISGPMGLKKSPGKSHESSHFACINSQHYHLHKGVWSRLSVVRSTLMHGIMKLSTDEFRPSHIVTALFETIPQKSRARAVAFFLARWGRKLEAECAGRSLFLPVALNGLGQEAPPEWEWYLTARQRTVASHLMRSQPNYRWDFGPQLPGPRQRFNVQTTPWDLPSAPLDADTLDAELAVFRKREGYRVSRALVKWHREPFCCGEFRTGLGRCPVCQKLEFDCPEGRLQMRRVRGVCVCDDCRDPWTGAAHRETCSWRPKDRVVTSWHCDCHGECMGWSNSPHVRGEVREKILKAAVRPRLTYDAGVGNGELSRPPRAMTWGFDPSSYSGAKFLDISRRNDEDARMLLEIDVAIAKATGDWRGLV